MPVQHNKVNRPKNSTDGLEGEQLQQSGFADLMAEDGQPAAEWTHHGASAEPARSGESGELPPVLPKTSAAKRGNKTQDDPSGGDGLMADLAEALDAAETIHPHHSTRRESSIDAQSVWQKALAELALQMTSATYDTWVRDTAILAYEDGEFIIGVPNAYARDWLDNRLRATIKRTLSRLMRRSVQVNFRVKPQPVADAHEDDSAPLYRSPAPEAEQMSSAQQPQRTMYQTSSRPSGVPLNANHTFDTFVVGNHNRLAHAAARAVAEHPGERFNPLFIYGGVGLGKTHLLHALGNEVAKRNLRVLYCTSEEFTNELISAIRNQNTEEFRNKYRQLDVLLIDDIQFIGGKESTQEEFFHTFNHLHAANRQVVISSDRPPKAIATLEARLRSRFEGGLQADISQPDFETRVAILQAKAADLGISPPLDVLMIVAERVESNIRELEGALNRLVLQARLLTSPLDRQLAENVLNNLAPQRTPREPTTVIRVVAEHFRLGPADLTGRTRTKDVALARQVAMYLLREENTLSLPAIGDLLGGRDHSTVRYGVDKVAGDLESNDGLRRDIMSLRDKIYSAPGTV